MDPDQQPSTESEQQPIPTQQPAAGPPANHARSYGKRPVWQWVVIYLIIAAVVYAIVYFVFFHHTMSGSGSSGY